MSEELPPPPMGGANTQAGAAAFSRLAAEQQFPQVQFTPEEQAANREMAGPPINGSPDSPHPAGSFENPAIAPGSADRLAHLSHVAAQIAERQLNESQ